MLNRLNKMAVALAVATGLLVAVPIADAADTADGARAAAVSGPSEGPGGPAASEAASATSAVDAGAAHARGEAVYTPAMTVSLTYEDRAELEAMVTEYGDALPQYTPTLSETATGARVGIPYNSADRIGSSDLRGPHRSVTAGPLVVGTLYDYTLRVQTTSYWHCSIYDPDGCSYRDATDTTYRWRFTWNGSETTATTYKLPKAKTTIKVGKVTKRGKRGWKFTATLMRNGKPSKGRLYGHYTDRGRWRNDSSWVTGSNGKLTLKFSGANRPYRYRLSAKTTATSLAARSKSVRIPTRR